MCIFIRRSCFETYIQTFLLYTRAYVRCSNSRQCSRIFDKVLLKHLKESVEDKRRSNTKSLSIIYIRHIVRNKMIVFQGCNDVIRDTLYEWS